MDEDRPRRLVIPAFVAQRFLDAALFPYMNPQSLNLTRKRCPVTEMMRMLNRIAMGDHGALAVTRPCIVALCSKTHLGPMSMQRLATKAVQNAFSAVLDILLRTREGGRVWAYGLYTTLALHSCSNHNFGAVLRVLIKRLDFPPPRNFVELCARYGSPKNINEMLRMTVHKFEPTPRAVRILIGAHKYSDDRDAVLWRMCTALVKNKVPLATREGLVRYCYQYGTAESLAGVAGALEVDIGACGIEPWMSNVCATCNRALGGSSAFGAEDGVPPAVAGFP